MKNVIVGMMIFCLLGVFVQTGIAEMKVALYASTGPLPTMKQWGELGAYLSAELGQPVTAIPIAPDKFAEEVKAQSCNFMLTTPTMAILLQEMQKAIPLVTINDKAIGTLYGGVIFAKKGSGIANAKDLKGKKVIAMGKVSAASYIFPIYHLKQQGIEPTDFAALEEAKKLEDIVLAVKAGLFDVGFVRTDVLESMVKAGKISLDEFVIIDQHTDPNFPYVHTTELYPNWCILASSQTDAALAAKAKASLLSVTPDSKLAQAAGLNGFVEALPLESLRDMMKAMKMPPYDK